MEISGGDSTPTSEASYSHSSTPNAQAQHITDGPVLLANARLASHPPTPNNIQMNTSSSCTPSSSSGEFLIFNLLIIINIDRLSKRRKEHLSRR